MKTSFQTNTVVILAFLLVMVGRLPGAQPPALQLEMIPPTVANEFSVSPELSWAAETGVNYVIQSSTNLADAGDWRSVDVAKSSGTIRWTGSDFEGATKFYRVFTQPLITELQPAFVNSEDSDARLYVSGQLLPTNGIVFINSQNFSGTTDSNGVLSVSLNGLPPGTPITGMISVLDAASNVVATLPVESPILYGSTPSLEHLQGPPTEPPASTQGLLIAFLSKKGYDYYQAQSALRQSGMKRGNPAITAQYDADADGYVGKKGYDYYQAQSALNSAGLQSNPAFQDNNNQGQMVDGVAIPKFLDYMKKGRSSSAAMASVVWDNRFTGEFDYYNVALAFGEFRCQQTDLAIPGAMLDFVWTRTYRSRTGPTTAQGAGWDFSFNVSLTQNTDGTLTLRPGNGRADTFYPHGTNWVRDEYFCEIRDLNSDGFPDVVFADTGKWLFHPSGPATGKLAQIIDRNGNTISLNYDTSGNLATIVDDLGRTNSLGYDTSGRIASVTDFTGRSVRYEYNTAGDLVSVISPPTTDFPGGITNRMTYTSGFPPALGQLNHNLTSCIDGKGQSQFEITYSATNNPASEDYDTVVSTQRGIEKKDIKRGMVIVKPSSHYTATKIIVRDALGNVSEGFYDSRGRCVRRLEYTGRAPNLNAPTTETDNRPVNKLRAEDPDYFEAQWTWNRDSLCTEETLPDGQGTQFIYESDFNSSASARKKGDCRVVRLLAAPGGGADLDGDGVSDISELAWRFEYDPRFGSPTAKTGGRRHAAATILANALLCERILASGNTGINSPLPDTYLHAARHGWDGTIKGRPPEAGRQYNPARDYLIGDTTIHNNPIYQASSYNGTKWEKVDNSESPISSRSSSNSSGMKIEDGWSCSASKRGGGLCFPIPGDGFVISATDPRGSVTEAGYDAQGNRVYVKNLTATLGFASPEDEQQTSRNSRGQLTAITKAPDATGFRRVDTFSYYTNGPMVGQLQSFVIDDRYLLGLKEYHAFEYDAVGNLTRYVDPRTNDWLFTYNALNWLI